MESLRRALFTLLPLALFASVAGAQTPSGTIVFDATEHDFEQVDEGDQARHVFTFRNEGQAPLRVTNVRPSCGCTTPEWTKEAVAPGATGTITVVYDSEGRPGPFRKSILVQTDGDPDQLTLHIQGHVRAGQLTDRYRQGHLRVDMDVADLGLLAPGENGHHVFRVQNAGERPIRFTEVVRIPDDVRIELPEAPLFTDDLVKINVVVLTDGMQGGDTFDHAIVVKTDDAEQPLKSFRLKGRVGGAGTQ